MMKFLHIVILLFFPVQIESKEVRLIRQIGAKKDQYLLDNRIVTRTDVQNLITYQNALAIHAKRDEQLRTIGTLVGQLVK